MPEICHQHDSRQKRQFWKSHVEQWQQSGLSQRAYCRNHGLKPDRFYYWRRRIQDPQGQISFLPVALPESLSARQKIGAVRIHAPNGFIVEFERPHGSQDVQELVSMVAGL